MKFEISYHQLKPTLRAIQNQHISVAIKNRSGKWSHEYFVIQELKEFVSDEVKATAIVLRSELHWEIVDIQSISGLKLNKYLHINGQLFSELKLTAAKENSLVLHNVP
ncbi:hypothetical protein [Chryseolinea sp. H1M3-3]|uniref:hypothetical protein n=1 Tax=Chryseolinea sp. H1M3-3 TaxID=3034144 RepID=UPI0023EE0D4F|nr:hypothetical protein [Chryseolinea sp. H1M3-3]